MTDPAIVAMEAYKEGQVEHQWNGLPRGLEADKEKRMSDLIDRRAAVEALYDWEMCYDWDEHCREEDPKPAYIISPSDVIEKLPSAQSERKTGKITYTHFSEELWGQSAICVSCGCKWQIAEYGEDNFCPNCGVKLER